MRIIFITLVLCVNLFAWELLGSSNKAPKQEVIVRDVFPMDVAYEKISARSALNSIREAMGMNSLLQNDLLNIAAQGHADYLVANRASSHYEREGNPAFMGVKPVDRTLLANYASKHVSENLSTHTSNAERSIDGLFSAIYHRFGFLSFGIDVIGVGVTQERKHPSNSAFVYVMANSALARLCHEESFHGSGRYYYNICKDSSKHIGDKAYQEALNSIKKYNPEVIVYPYDGQIEVPPVFYDESPDPLPNHEVSGFPISIAFNDYYISKVTLLSFKLYDDKNHEIEDVLLMDKSNDPNQRFTDKQFALFPLQRLDYNKEYRVEVNYRVGHKNHALRWYFQTQKPTEALHIVKGDNSTISLRKGESHVLYFPPLNAHDMLKNIQFPASVDVRFIDQNTLKVSPMDDSLKHFTIKSKRRTVHIKLY